MMLTPRWEAPSILHTIVHSDSHHHFTPIASLIGRAESDSIYQACLDLMLSIVFFFLLPGRFKLKRGLIN